jgi:hypothetical protein
MENKNFRSIDLNKLNNKKSVIVSSRIALKDVNTINWSEDVVSGKKKITVSNNR